MFLGFFLGFFFYTKVSVVLPVEKSCKKKTSASAGAVEAVTPHDTKLSKNSQSGELQLWGNLKVKRAMPWF